MADPIVTGREAAVLREDMRGWRIKPALDHVQSFDLFVEPPKYDWAASTRPAHLITITPATVFKDLWFHTHHHATHPSYGEPDPANWIADIPRPVVEALFHYASLPLRLPAAAFFATDLRAEWIDLEPPLDTRIGFCRTCLIEPVPAITRTTRTNPDGTTTTRHIPGPGEQLAEGGEQA